MEETKLEEMIRLRQPPGLAGVSDGPGSGIHEMVFDRPDIHKEIPMTLAKMEAAGRLKDPSAMAAAKVKMDSLKHKPREKLDYQKGDHPLD